MGLNVNFDDNIFKIKSRDGGMASLWWGNENGILPEWTSFAYIALSSAKEETFKYAGNRSIPPEADRIIARVTLSNGMSTEEFSQLIPPEYRTYNINPNTCLYIASDLHLCKKELVYFNLLNYAKDCDALLLAGDLTNDGTSEQLIKFRDMFKPVFDNIPVLPVAGNHDFPIIPQIDDKHPFGWYDLQNYALDRAEILGIKTERSECGTYIVWLNDIEIIGLNCVTDYRKFKFPEGQIEWLAEHLDKCNDERTHIILCHAPLILHNPQRPHDGQPYLNKDIKLQKIINEHKNIIFISGHTHFSPNDYNGCTEYDSERNIIYINDGSVCPTTSKWQEPIIPAEWREGIMTKLLISDKLTEIMPVSLKTGKKISRGYYRLDRT